MHRKIILVGDVTDHGGTVLTGSPDKTFDRVAIARVGDTVSCPKHGNNAIVSGNSAISIDGKAAAVEGGRTACGSRLIASQTMFNTTESRQDKNGRYANPLWDHSSPAQPVYNPYHASPFLPDEPTFSQVPPDNGA
jgi:uncharacterized Zn-binding protein involved in type VI secretion